MNWRSWIKLATLVGYFAFIAISAVIDFTPGKQIGTNFIYFWADLIKILPFAFVLIGNAQFETIIVTVTESVRNRNNTIINTIAKNTTPEPRNGFLYTDYKGQRKTRWPAKNMSYTQKF